MPLVEWDQSFSVKVKKFDNQHKVLFDIINALYSIIDISSNREELKKLIENLRLYTIKHFSAEERYFDLYNYPETEEHKREHKVFIDRIADYKQASLEENDLIISEILEFLVDWLVIHIKTADRKYANFMNKNGIH